jgi:hypothetical protein
MRIQLGPTCSLPVARKVGTCPVTTALEPILADYDQRELAGQCVSVSRPSVAVLRSGHRHGCSFCRSADAEWWHRACMPDWPGARDVAVTFRFGLPVLLMGRDAVDDATGGPQLTYLARSND